jgi:hypothetical protein
VRCTWLCGHSTQQTLSKALQTGSQRSSPPFLMTCTGLLTQCWAGRGEAQQQLAVAGRGREGGCTETTRDASCEHGVIGPTGHSDSAAWECRLRCCGSSVASQFARAPTAGVMAVVFIQVAYLHLGHGGLKHLVQVSSPHRWRFHNAGLASS